MPESVTDRCTKAHEYIFLVSKSPKYYFDNEAVQEVAVTKENRPGGIVRDREYGYDSKQKVIRAMWKETAKRPGERQTFGGEKARRDTIKKTTRDIAMAASNGGAR